MGMSLGGPRDTCGSESPWRWPSTVRGEASGPRPGGRGAIARDLVEGHLQGLQ